MSNSLIVFLRKPILGQVKSRLAVDFGEAKALDIYQWLIEKTKNLVHNFDARICLYFDQNEGDTDEWMKEHRTRTQRGENIGYRMLDALHVESEFSDKMVLIGSDCPDLGKEIITEAFHWLDSHDIVLGPAMDGGFYLIALKKVNDSIFENVIWGSDEVLGVLRENVKNLGLSLKLLEPLMDVDTMQDFLTYESEFNHYKAAQHVIERAGQ